MSRFLVLSMLALATVLGPTPRTRADVVVSTFGPGDSYDTSAGASARGPDFPGGLFVG